MFSLESPLRTLNAGRAGCGVAAIHTPQSKIRDRLCRLAVLPIALLAGGCLVAHPSGPCGPACPVITDAAHIIEYPTDRLKILKRVAARPELSTHEQIYLVNAVMAVGFSSDKAVALVTLIENPCCTAETRQHIRKSLKTVRMLGRDQRRVIDALAKAEASSEPSTADTPTRQESR
jgi:hypothetical protein